MADSENRARDFGARQTLARGTSPEWTGDLDDDCTAYWAGFVLRAEEMNRGRWWWAVSDLTTQQELESIHDHEGERCRSGKEARMAAEAAVHKRLKLTT